MPRPTKLTETTTASILKNVRTGASRKDIAAAAGIDNGILLDWLHRGQASEDEADPFYQFYQSFTRAESEVALIMSGRILQAAGEDWRAAESWLKRRRRDEWGDNLALGKLDDDELIAAAKAIVGAGTGDTSGGGSAGD